MITEKTEIKNLIQSSIQTITMYRINYNGLRGYVLPEPFHVYSGLTGALSSATFKGDMDSKRLGKWRDKMVEHLGGQQQQEAYLQSMADFGSLVHEAIVRIKENGGLDWVEERTIAESYFENSAKSNGIPVNSGVIRSQVFEYCKSVASILQWVHEQVLEIYAIESMCKSDELGIATPVDVVCKIKGNINVSVNIKTSSQFSNHQREQVCMEMLMWNETYPKYPVTKTALLRPKDWSLKKGIPTYEFELVEDTFTVNTLKRLRLAKELYHNFPESVSFFSGYSKLGEIPKIETKTLQELFNSYEHEI